MCRLRKTGSVMFRRGAMQMNVYRVLTTHFSFLLVQAGRRALRNDTQPLEVEFEKVKKVEPTDVLFSRILARSDTNT